MGEMSTGETRSAGSVPGHDRHISPDLQLDSGCQHTDSVGGTTKAGSEVVPEDKRA